MKNALVLLLIFLPLIAQSQEKWTFKYAPLSTLHPIYPAFHVGSEYKLGGKSAVEVELGILFPKNSYRNAGTIYDMETFGGKNEGVFMNAAYRNYFSEERRAYWSFLLGYGYNHLKRTDTFDATPEFTASQTAFFFCTECVEETYWIRQHTAVLVPKFGYVFPLKGGWSLDAYFGLGLRWLNNKHSGNESLHRYPASADGWITFYNNYYPGSYLLNTPTCNVGIKVGYSLGDD